MKDCPSPLGTVCMDPACPVHFPKRTRPGDQVLPTGDTTIPDDQSLIIQDLEKRRQLGISRYGQGHRPFNGRDTLLDLYEEQLDLLVYLRSIRRASEASRDLLVEVVARAIEKVPQANDVGVIAETAVDRIMSWVSAQILNEKQYAGTRATHLLERDTDYPDHASYTHRDPDTREVLAELKLPYAAARDLDGDELTITIEPGDRLNGDTTR